MKARKTARTIRNKGQQAALESGLTARVLAKTAGVSTSTAHSWLEGKPVPDDAQRLALEQYLQIAQHLWLVPATDADQQHALPAPPPAPSPAAGVQPFEHVPGALLPAYRSLRDEALLGGSANVYAAGEGKPLSAAGRPSPWQALRRLALVELWLAYRLHPEPDDEIHATWEARQMLVQAEVEKRVAPLFAQASDLFDGQTERAWLDGHPGYKPPPFGALVGRTFDPAAVSVARLCSSAGLWSEAEPVETGDGT